MLEAVWKHGVLFYAVGVMCVLGVISKITVSLTLRRLVKEAGKMGKSLHPLMKLVRAKFEHACMVSDKVQNIRAFVDKYMYEYKVLWIKLHSWRQMVLPGVWSRRGSRRICGGGTAGNCRTVRGCRSGRIAAFVCPSDGDGRGLSVRSSQKLYD